MGHWYFGFDSSLDGLDTTANSVIPSVASNDAILDGGKNGNGLMVTENSYVDYGVVAKDGCFWKMTQE